MLLLSCLGADAAAIRPRQAEAIAADDVLPPSLTDPRWQSAALPDARNGSALWWRIAFERPRQAAADEGWALYLPYLYGGGKVWLNGELVASVQQAAPGLRVRWERPHLLPLPLSSLHAGPNVLLLRVANAEAPALLRTARPAIGPQDELRPAFDRRFFWVRTVPWITVVVGVGVGLFFLAVWWRRRDERLYGLFGLAVLLWSLRTTTFVFDTLPAAWWPLWRLLYHVGTGGSVIVMTLFALALAGWYRPRVAWALLAYWLLGPLLFLAAGAHGDELVSRYWTAGLIPVGLGLIGISAAAAWRQRSSGTIALVAAMAFAVASGVHDYLMATGSGWLTALAPAWSERRIFLLHHGANLLLVVMLALFGLRFVKTLRDIEDMNRSLEARVAEREREIESNYTRIAAMQREQAAVQERQRIMQDLHDGLGSQLLISLLKVERGELAGVAQMLRVCIADMRLAIEALAGGDDHDFGSALGSFLFRWEAQLRDAGIAPAWQIDSAGAALALPPHTALQVLRVLQEALTNVVKHARATRVRVRVGQSGGMLRLAVEDDGCGFSEVQQHGRGRGLANMRARAARLGATLQVRTQPGATCITLDVATGAPPDPHA